MADVVEIVVVYNEPKTLEDAFLRSNGLDSARLVLIENLQTPRGLPAIFNEHKRASVADWIVFCHQDFIVFESEWLDRVRVLAPDACYGPIGVNSEGVLLGRIMQTDGSLLGAPRNLAEVMALDEQCIIVPRAVFSRIDFDEQFPFDFYVHDYCLSVRPAGFSVRTLQLDCQHRSKTLHGAVDTQRYQEAKQRFLAKYRDANPMGLFNLRFKCGPCCWQLPGESPTITAELALIPPGSRVLEVGAAGGHVTSALKKKGCEVTVVEIDTESAQYARPYCARLIVGDIETLDVGQETPGPFDVVLFGDVLEHLKDPGAVIRKVRSVLAPAGFLVVSIPNVAHGSVRLHLLAGNFDYQKYGILDATHLRFFTARSIRELFHSNGYDIRDLHRTRWGMLDREFPVDGSRVSSAVLRQLAADPEATTGQFVFRAVPAETDPRLRSEDAWADPSWDHYRSRHDLAHELLVEAWAHFGDEGPGALHKARRLAARSFALEPTLKSLLYMATWLLPGTWLRAVAARRHQPEKRAS